MEQQDEVRVAWGTGIAGHVAESGEPVNIPDAYQVNHERTGFSDERGESSLNGLTARMIERSRRPRENEQSQFL